MAGTDDNYGILACHGYLPRWRLAREDIHAAIGWARGMGSAGRGERRFANWDEDALTLAVEACRGLLDNIPATQTEDICGLQLASTSLPFADRSNAGVVREALHLPGDICLAELSGGRRAGIAALAELNRVRNGLQLLCATECIDALPGSDAEAQDGHAAAAVLLGPTSTGLPLLARVLASDRLQDDFVDRYRMAGQRHEYRLEARWLRDAGTLPQAQALIQQVLERAELAAGEIDHLLAPFDASTLRSLKKSCGLAAASVDGILAERVGLCGSAHPILQLVHTLEHAEAGQTILLVGAGQGLDVLLLRVENEARSSNREVAGQLEGGRLESNYSRYLGIRELLEIDAGLRAERDTRTAHSAAYRRHDELNGFVGGLCADCGRLQFPRAHVCVHCHSESPQQPTPMAELTGEVNSFTEDWLAYSPRPPLIFGNIHFPGGANVLMEFSDVLPGELQVGMQVRMAFRIKDHDRRRGFRRYFWKPVPLLYSPDGASGNG